MATTGAGRVRKTGARNGNGTDNGSAKGARTRRAPARLEGGIAQAAWLSERLLLVVGAFAPRKAERLSWSARLAEAGEEAEPHLLVLPPRHAAPEDAPTHVLAVLRVDDVEAAGGRAPAVSFACGAAALEVGGEDVAAALVDVRTLVRESLAGLDAAARERIVPWFAQAASLHDGEEGGYSLARTLHVARESLRERRRAGMVAAEDPRGLQVDAVLGVDATTCWVKGWARNADARITGLTLVSPEGSPGEFLARTLRVPRPDVEDFYATGAAGGGDGRSGFVGLAEIAAPSRLGGGWIVEMSDAVGESIEVEAPPVVRDALAVRTAILTDFALARRPEDPARAALFEPALTRLQARLAADVGVEDVRQHGRAPADPDVSIVVPLYKRIDFLEHQLTQFARDPEIAAADLIYVLDSPELAEPLERLAPEVHALTGVPFRVVTLARNAGFSGANNAGAAFARGGKLLLLNSDVLPDRPGWLGTMSGFFDATPGIGALAPKLLYEDDSLQHAGMYFLRPPGSTIWENMHYYKGLARTTPAANVARAVPAVTGACLMIERERYERMGGLRGQFVQGDYEDSDLCLRLHEDGLASWYLPDAELYHLEAQSYPNELRRTTSAYNTWLQSHLWSERIEAVMNATEEMVS
jgi:GT2 family glycosyltransferase